MRKNKFAVRLLALVLLIGIVLSPLSVNALGVIKETGDTPYNTFTYWDDANTKQAVVAKGMYNFDKYLEKTDIVPEGALSLNDICFDINDNAYLLDSDAGKIYCLDKNFKYVKTIGNITAADGTAYNYAGAAGMFVSANNLLYICDTENARVLISNLDGALSNILYLPDSSLIPDNLKTNFRPTAVTVDSSEYVYVLSDGSYYGAMLYTPWGEFLGFYGANTVQTTVLGFLSSIWDKLTKTDAILAVSKRELPFQFTDLYVDSADFVYTATGTSAWGVQKGQIKRMSPGGLNAIKSNEVTFGSRYGSDTLKRAYFSNMKGVAVNDDNYIFTFDGTLGGIYIYNNDCVLMNAFGTGSLGDADQIGIPGAYKAIDVNSSSTIAVIDSTKVSVSIFKLNDYGKTVFAADTATRNGDYEKARPLWEEVLKNDRNSQLAYSGLARTYFASGDYHKAMDYAKKGFNSDTYSSAFEYVRRDFIAKNINIMALIIVLLIAGLVTLHIYKKKHNITFIKNVELKLLSKVTFHPGDVFAEVKWHGRGSVLIGSILVVVYYITAIVKETASGFLFKSHVTSSFNSLMVLVQTLGFVLLWTICNWAVCTLMDGKGKIKEIFIVTSYALVPLIVGNITYTVVSNLIVSDEAAFLTIFMTVMKMLTALIMIFGMIKIHDYTFGQFVGTSILSFLGILIVIFLGVAIFILIQQSYSFIATIFREIFYR